MRNDTGCALLPQSIMFDLEIPESSAIRDAQDVGKSVHDYKSDSAVAAAFDQLAKNVQYVLNGIHRENITESAFEEKVMLAFKLCAAALVIAFVGMNKPIPEQPSPRPLAPQQVMENSGQNTAIVHTFAKGDNITRLAKHAISAFRAVVPTQKEINAYVTETIEAYNLTRMPGEPLITDIYRIPTGIELTFYPPMNLTNKQEKTMIPVYRYFMNLVNDAYPYVTGDWCERGMGGGQPHYGMDVAGAYGSDVISPVDGLVVLKTDNLVGRTVGVAFDNSIIFFCHLEKRYVKDGDTVKKGEPIGTIGMTGRTSGPHVHIGYGIKSQSRHDISFGKQSYRVSDPKHFFYHMAYVGSVEEQEQGN
jgi:murein DD-endopeptidase MepM/ murein hydrolase activator NlpD